MEEYKGTNKKEAIAAIEAVLERHNLIKHHFFSGIGLRLMFYDSQIANNVMLRAIDEYRTVVLPIHDSFVCIEEFKDLLQDLKIDLKYSGHYLSEIERLYQEEFGDQLDYNIPLDPLQKFRRDALMKQAYAAQKEYEIVFEDAFRSESIDEKYTD